MTRWKSGLLWVLPLALAGNVARAEEVAEPKVWAEADVEVGAPKTAKHARLSQADQGVALQIGDKRVSLPWPNVVHAAVEALPVSPERSVLRVTATTATGEYGALVGGKTGHSLLWQGSLALVGDPGERTGMGIVTRAQGDHARIQVGERFEALRDCAGTPVLLKAREVDPQTLSLVNAVPASALPAAEPVAATPRATLTSLSALSTLRIVAASDERASGVRTSPPLLTDGDPATDLRARAGRTPQFVRATLGATGFPVTRLEFAAPAAPATLPPQVVVQLGEHPAQAVTLDPGAPVQSVVLPEPVDSVCLSLTIPGPVPKGQTWALGELHAITALDEGDAATLLAESLVAGGPGAAGAPRLLKELGGAGASATLDVWPRLDTRGRKRALPVLSRYLAEPKVLEAVVGAARDDPALREPALSALAASDAAGREALVTLASEPGPTGQRAIALLGGVPGSSQALLQLLAQPGGPDRPVLRAALAEQASSDPDRLALAAEGFRAAASDPALAALAMSVAGSGPRLIPVVEQACEKAAYAASAAFVERYRCALAFTTQPAQPEPDAWLEKQARAALEWMQRQAAIEALAARQSPSARGTALDLLQDPYPRVRAAAARALAKPADGQAVQGNEAAQLSQLAVTDHWPLVRAAAVESLASVPDAAETLRGRVEDPSRIVRTAAIEVLAARRDAEAWPRVHARLAREKEFPEVRSAAIAYARSLCLQESTEVLIAQLARGVTAEASREDGSLAVQALRTLRSLGGAAAARAEDWLAGSGAPPELSQAAGQPSPCGVAATESAPNT